MKYSICYRLLKEGVNPYHPLLDQIDCDNDDQAVYYSIFHTLPDRPISQGLLEKMWEKLENYDTNEDFVFWILNEDTKKYVYKNLVEDDLKWYVLAALKGGWI